MKTYKTYKTSEISRFALGLCFCMFGFVGCKPPPRAPVPCIPSVIVKNQADIDALKDVSCIDGDLTIGKASDVNCWDVRPPFRNLNLTDAFATLERVSGIIQFSDVELQSKVSFPALATASKIHFCLPASNSELGFPVLESGSLYVVRPLRLAMPSLTRTENITVIEMESPIHFPSLVSARQEFRVVGFSKVSLPRLKSAGTLTLKGKPPKREMAGIVETPVLESVENLHVQTSLGGDCAGTESLFQNLQTVSESAFFDVRNAQNCKIDFLSLKTVGGVTFSAIGGSPSLNLPKLEKAGNIYISSAIRNFDAPNLTKLSALSVITAGNLEQISIPRLAEMDRLSIRANENLRLVNLRALEVVANRLDFRGKTRPDIGISVPLADVGILTLKKTTLRDWPFPFLKKATSISVFDNPLLEDSTQEKLRRFSQKVVTCGNVGDRPCTKNDR